MDFYHYDFYRISKREEEGAGEEESNQQFPVKQPCCLSPQFCPVAGTIFSSSPTAARSAKAHTDRCTWVVSNFLTLGIGIARKCNAVLKIENVLLSEQKTF